LFIAAAATQERQGIRHLIGDGPSSPSPCRASTP
jgi:hypothetical protein